jgi:hypothetical protein
MSGEHRDAVRLQVALGQLRAALRTAQAPPPDEEALRVQFRAAVRRRDEAPATATRSNATSRLHFAAAAVVVLALGAVVATVLLRVELPAPVPIAAEQPQQRVPVSAFQPLLNAPRLSSSAYSVVRVRIPLSAFAVVPDGQADGTIEADLLVGEDGLARGIRFPEADALLASTAGR